MLQSEMRAHLTDKLLPFWQGLQDARYGGYYGYMDRALRVYRWAPKGCILNSRILWFFSSAAIALRDDALLSNARHAYAFGQRFRDAENGGLCWSATRSGRPLDSAKHTYNQAFGVYALAAYYRATGDEQALERAMALYGIIESRMRDENGYLEAFDRRFRPARNGKLSENGVMAHRTMNTLLHVLEAYTGLYAVSGDGDVRRSLRGALEMAERRLYNAEQRRLDVFFDADWRPLLDMQSYGHDIEASWLIDEAAELVCTPEERAAWSERTLALARSVLERAYTERGVLNERVGGSVDGTRVWWVQAEAVVGFANAYQKSGDEAFRDAAEAVWRYIGREIVDSRPGAEWFWSREADGRLSRRPIVEPWKCPYHNGRMCMELMRRGL